ncbi:hypothetical protein ILUMI_04048 [Ignelater luminosus]|uniref:Carboxylic ester hydrolase n=1 Tax=Ignelater luminosus TaxID=2038154 RepID=A0A8K0DKJ6_IGNLU|nr:hypothetical protein ILUMI_04048 [Ignelater luminosus]
MLKVFLCIILFTLIVHANSSEIEVNISQGALKGKYQKTWKGRAFSAFTGIPYAKPPVGDLRFKAPVPSDPWNGVLDATKPHAMCPQMNVYLNDFEINGNEDCLYLNVYTPKVTSSSETSLPVMFYIHGGGWMCGSADLYGPNILLDQDIVLVVTNYRLGPLGFLSTGDEVVPGNNGLKDQSLAIKWVKDNIKHFGGNPDLITVFGQSAGGASTHYHMLSPLSKDLISGAISHSGTALGTWGLSTREESVNTGRRLAQFLNCPTDPSKEMVECLRKIDAYDIVKQDTKFLEWSYDPMIPFKPVIEPDLEGAFLTEDPIDIIKSDKAAKVPFITGFTTEDGALKSAHIYNNSKLVKEFNEDFEKLAPYLFVYHKTSANKDVGKKIRDFYFGDKQIDESMKDEVTNMFTDGWFLLPEDAAVRLHTKYTKQPVYYFLFGYRGKASFGTGFGDPNYDYGVCHCDELLYLFSNNPFEDDYKSNQHDKKIIDIMTTLWANFARTGNPTPDVSDLIPTKWEPIKTDKLEYYFIKNGTFLYMDENLYSERAKFWRSLPIDFRRERIRDEL